MSEQMYAVPVPYWDQPGERPTKPVGNKPPAKKRATKSRQEYVKPVPYFAENKEPASRLATNAAGEVEWPEMDFATRAELVQAACEELRSKGLA